VLMKKLILYCVGQFTENLSLPAEAAFVIKFLGVFL
jgi:hypothetical protein